MMSPQINCRNDFKVGVFNRNCFINSWIVSGLDLEAETETGNDEAGAEIEGGNRGPEAKIGGGGPKVRLMEGGIARDGRRPEMEKRRGGFLCHQLRIHLLQMSPLAQDI